jgi:hypothetical protein
MVCGRILWGRIVRGRIVWGRIVWGRIVFGKNCSWEELFLGRIVLGKNCWGRIVWGRIHREELIIYGFVYMFFCFEHSQKICFPLITIYLNIVYYT